MLLLMVVTVATNVYLFIVIPKGFFPEQDTGRISGTIQAEQDVSFQSMQESSPRSSTSSKATPRSTTSAGFTGGEGCGGTAANIGRLFISLKPFGERKVECQRGDGEAARKARPGAGGAHLPSAGPGSEHRGQDQQRPVPVYPPGATT